jgi:hypothetical protein
MNRLPGLDLIYVLAIVWVMLYGQLLKPHTRGAQPLWGQFSLRLAFRITLPAGAAA